MLTGFVLLAVTLTTPPTFVAPAPTRPSMFVHHKEMVLPARTDRETTGTETATVSALAAEVITTCEIGVTPVAHGRAQQRVLGT